MSLLPNNSTKFERDVEAAIKYAADPSVLHGFKFKNVSSNITLALSWEYSQVQLAYGAAGGDSINGSRLSLVEFHRLRGTPAALKNALSWYDFHDITIEEEPPGEHFAEFQIGLDEIPNSFGVDSIISVAGLAAPLRSRLSRMYNSLYDVRRFMLDDSKFGDFLSDHSGIRLQNDGPKLSFGRQNAYELQTPKILEKHIHKREHFADVKNVDTYKLDFANLDDAPMDAINRKAVTERNHTAFNSDSVGKIPTQLFEIHRYIQSVDYFVRRFEAG
jgi:hypothetical protein